MAAVRIMITFLLLPTSCTSVTTMCEILSVEAGRNTTLTTYFSEDMRSLKVKDFIVILQRQNSKESEIVSCRFTNGAAECDKTLCCTWDKQVTNVFRVYIHNVSQEFEGRFWGVVLPAEGAQHTNCNFSLKAPTCSSDSINATNGVKICDNQPVAINKTCTVICNDGYNFQDTQTSVTYTCVGSNKWSPELPAIFCEYHSEDVQTNSKLYALFSLLIFPVLAILIWKCFIKKRTKRTEEDTAGTRQSLMDGRKDETDNHNQMHHQSVEEDWLECIKKWYPNFYSQTYFVPTIHFMHVPYSMEKIAGKEKSVPQVKEVALASHSDVRDNRALQQVLNGIRTLANSVQPKEAMFVVSQLQFNNYLGEPTFATAAAHLPRLSTLSEDLRQQHYGRGDFDVLIIHSQHGLFILEISSVGEDFTQDKATVEKEDADLRNNVNEVVKQLNKNEHVLKHFTSDLQTSINITKCLAFPNITSSQLQRSINRNPFKQDLCECLGVQSVDDTVKLCLLKDQLSEEQTPSDLHHISLQALGQWWQNVVSVPKPKPLEAPILYEQLLVRFCGPATAVEVHCFTAPRLNVRTQGDVVSESGERVVRFVLFPEQVDILHRSPPRAFLSGPPGTGKTFHLIMQGLAWIQRGYNVHVVSTWDGSRASTFLIEYQLKETTKTSTARSRVLRHQFDLMEIANVESAARSLKFISKDLQLCVIADTVVRYRKHFRHFCDQLSDKVPSVNIWGASMFFEDRPILLEEFNLAKPLRPPPVVAREVKKAGEIKNKIVHDYAICNVPVPTDGPPLKRISHRDGQKGHTRVRPHKCVKCGYKVARILKKLNVGQTGDSNEPPPLKYCDVLVLYCDFPSDDQVECNDGVTTAASGFIKGLHDSHVPVRVVEKNDEETICDTALHVGDVVTVANMNDVLGLERKVVIVENANDAFSERLYAMSRCMSQLVVIDYLLSSK